MDIRNWPIDRIMQLPDCVFGRRYPVIVRESVIGSATEFILFGQDLPREFVLWDFIVYGSNLATKAQAHIGLRWNDALPANDNEFLEGQRIFPDVFSDTGLVDFTMDGNVPTQIRNQKFFIDRHEAFMAGRIQNTVAQTLQVVLAFVVSRIPSEVPDWILKP